MTDESGYTKRETDWLGRQVEVHYNKDHEKVGETRAGTNWLGHFVQEHYNKDHEKVGQTERGTDWAGHPIQEHYNKEHEKVGETKRGANWAGHPIQEHYNKDSEKVGETKPGTDWLGNPRTEHRGENFKSKTASSTISAPSNRHNERSIAPVEQRSADATAGRDKSTSTNAGDNASHQLARASVRFWRGLKIFIILGIIYHGGKFLFTEYLSEIFANRMEQSSASSIQCSKGSCTGSDVLNPTQRLGLNGIGPIRIGMTPIAIANSMQQPLDKTGENQDCYHVRPRMYSNAISIMITHGRVSRVEIHNTFSTFSGIKVGSLERSVLSTYFGQVDVQPDRYDASHHTITLRPKAQKYKGLAMVFKTDGVVVKAIYAGSEYAVQLNADCQ